MVDNSSEEMFECNMPTDKPISNVLEKGRYKFTVTEIVNGVSKSSGNKMNTVTLNVQGKKLTEYFPLGGNMDWKWGQFLRAIGIREKQASFLVSKKTILEGTGLVDIYIKNKSMEDGTLMPENKISSFSPIEQEIAPANGVEPESAVAEKKEEVKTEDGL